MNKDFLKIEDFIRLQEVLCFLTQTGESNEPQVYENDFIEFFIPLCPDYSFELNCNNERVHDFTSLGDDKGIVYKKLIEKSQPLFNYLSANKINYYAHFLIADVEVSNNLILKKLKTTQEEFIEKCTSSTIKIDEDIKIRNINGKCVGMREYFKEQGYDFHAREAQNLKKIRSGLANKEFVSKVIGLRDDLYNFWFNLPKEERLLCAYKDISMYAAFAEEIRVSKGIILCADSEVLSCAYNCLKANQTHTPVIYVKGNY